MFESAKHAVLSSKECCYVKRKASLTSFNFGVCKPMLCRWCRTLSAHGDEPSKVQEIRLCAMIKSDEWGGGRKEVVYRGNRLRHR